MNEELLTSRLRLTPVTAEDGPELHRLWSAPGVREHLWDGRLIAAEQSLQIAAQSAALFDERRLGLWAARLREDGRLVGFAGFWFFRSAHELELLYGLDQAWWGQGLAAEMAACMLSYGFGELEFKEIRASTEPGNHGSLRVLKRLGFLPERRMPLRPDPGTLYFRLPRRVFEGREA